MSDETPTGVEDLDRIAAFFGDGVEWSMPDDERWGGELFVGSEVVARIRAEVERLTRERDRMTDAYGRAEDSIARLTERAETAERERDEARRNVCRRRARDNGPAFGNDAEFERRARELAERLGWGCFVDEDPAEPWCEECEDKRGSGSRRASDPDSGHGACDGFGGEDAY